MNILLQVFVVLLSLCFATLLITELVTMIKDCSYLMSEYGFLCFLILNTLLFILVWLHNRKPLLRKLLLCVGALLMLGCVVFFGFSIFNVSLSTTDTEDLLYPLHEGTRQHWNRARYQFVVNELEMTGILIDAKYDTKLFADPQVFSRNCDSIYFMGTSNYGILHTSTERFETFSTISNMTPEAQKVFNSYNDTPREVGPGIDPNKKYIFF